MTSDTGSRTCKTIILVGATGAGKSTLLDSLMNYILGVEWKDGHRMKIINLTKEEKERHKTGQEASQTEWVTAYAIPTDGIPRMSYDLCVIDTPGFGDISGVQRDQQIVSQIEYLFKNPQLHGVDSIDGICFLIQAPMIRLTATQRYIFDQILSLFGNDVKKNIFVMATFADLNRPPVINSLKKAGVPYMKYFKFNNSAFCSTQEKQGEEESSSGSEEESDTEMSLHYWNIGMTSFQKFFLALEHVEPQSLTLTRSVLTQREKLRCDLQYIETKVKESTQKMTRLKQEREALKVNEEKIAANQDFEYEVDEEKMVKVPIPKGIYVTNCSSCHETCHKNCAFDDNKEKQLCIAMENGKCTVCTNKCDWTAHYNHGYIFELAVQRVKRTSSEIKQCFDSARMGKDNCKNIILELENQYRETTVEVTKRVNRARKCLLDLKEIALKPDPLNEIDYIDLLIQDEKRQAKEGYLGRLEQLVSLKNRAKLLKDIKEQNSVIYASLEQH